MDAHSFNKAMTAQATAAMHAAAPTATSTTQARATTASPAAPARPTTATTAAAREHPYTARFGRALPRELAAESTGMGWREFCSTYAPTPEGLRLRDWNETNLGRGVRRFEAIFGTSATGPAAHRCTVIAAGEIAACSEMLHELGHGIEIERFHQHHTGDTWATIIRCQGHHAGNGGHGRTWALGLGRTGPESARNAMISASTRLA
ncbi:hypothetical protein [Dietzia sp.]|uniref:hypothetical protein n=1 Tax=Dietzia sp. TaxID=1871616 RepID=UPI002FD92350